MSLSLIVFIYCIHLYAVTVALNYKEIGKHSEIITNIKLFINKCNWQEINFQSEKNDWKKFDENNLTIAFNVLYAKKEKIYPAYVSKHKTSYSWKTSYSFLMIRNEEGCHYITVIELPALLRGNTSKHHSNFYCLNCLHSFETENKRESHKKVCKNKDFCGTVMSSEGTKILELNQYQKSDKALFTIYAYLECLREKIDGCKNNPENTSATKLGKYYPSGFSICTISSFKSIGNKHDVYI